MRYDQFMRLGWKVLVPVALLWILVVATMRVLSREYDLTAGQIALYVGIPVLVLVLVGVWLWPDKVDDPTVRKGVPPTTSGAFPTPPLDLVVPPNPPLVKRDLAKKDAVGAGRRPGGNRA
nr:NADH-quinone oxidoreductase subunit H [Geodermatophilaceae bacterium]